MEKPGSYYKSNMNEKSFKGSVSKISNNKNKDKNKDISEKLQLINIRKI